MSKWTLEKILACEEIKAGCWLQFSNCSRMELVVYKGQGQFIYYSEHYKEVQVMSVGVNYSEFNFYRSDKSEILPPKDKKKIKEFFWVNFYPHGVKELYVKEEYAHKFAQPDRIACEYFEREVEVEE